MESVFFRLHGFLGDKGGVSDAAVSLLGSLTLIYSRSDCSDGTKFGPTPNPEGFLGAIFGGGVDIVILDGGTLTFIYSGSTISGAGVVIDDDFGDTGGVFIPGGNFGGIIGSFFILNFESIVRKKGKEPLNYERFKLLK